MKLETQKKLYLIPVIHVFVFFTTFGIYFRYKLSVLEILKSEWKCIFCVMPIGVLRMIISGIFDFPVFAENIITFIEAYIIITLYLYLNIKEQEKFEQRVHSNEN